MNYSNKLLKKARKIIQLEIEFQQRLWTESTWDEDTWYLEDEDGFALEPTTTDLENLEKIKQCQDHSQHSECKQQDKQ